MEHLKSEFCFVCNIKTKKYYKRFCEIIIKGTGTRLGNLIERFFNEVGSKRRVNDEFNVLCFDCLGRIQSYDQMVLFVKKSEQELRNLISKTEIDLLNKPFESDESENMENNPSLDDLISAGNPSIINNEKLIRNELTITKTQPKDKVLHGSIPKAMIPNETEVMEIETLSGDLISSGNLPMNNGKFMVIIPAIENIQPKDRVHHESIPRAIESERSNSINTMNKEYLGFCSKYFPEKKDYCYEKKAYICKKCNGHSRTKKMYLHHQKCHLRTCDICDILFKRTYQYERHKKIHESHGRLVCHICYYESKDEEAYKNHVQAHKNANKNQCVICDTICPGASFRRHVQFHNEPTRLCHQCGKKYHSADALRIHLQTHAGIRSFKCDICSKTFADRSKIVVHMATHVGKRNFACSICGMRFTRKGNCLQHEKRHSVNTKTIKCTFCPAAFEHKFHLNQHLKRKHNAQLPHDTNPCNDDESD